APGERRILAWGRNAAIPWQESSPPFMRFLLLALALCLTSCTTNPIEKRIKKHPERFAALTDKEKENVRRGVVSEGMSTDAVFLAWGRPGQVLSGSRHGRERERWAYFRSAPVSTVSFGYGSYYG